MIRKFVAQNPLKAQLAFVSQNNKSTKKDSKKVQQQKVEKSVEPKVAQKVVQQQQQKSQERPRYWTANYENFTNLEYKKYPNHLTHFDKSHKDYVPSERDEYTESQVREEHNKWIDDLKRDLQTQRKLHDILNKMDRPYLRGLPGQSKNITGGIVDNFKPVGVPEGQAPEDKASEFLEMNFKNENRWTDQNVFHPKFAKMTHYDVTWQKELEARPVNKNFHPDKGYKYDVMTPYEQRYPYLADRLGHPEILGNPWERLLRLESEMYHPNYLDQPHVQMPSTSPHESLDFQPGEVVYENTQLLEWAKFWKLTGLTGLAWSALFVPYQILFKTHLPLDHALDNLFISYSQHTMYHWDINQLHIPVASLSIAYTLYIATSYAHRISKDYVVKMQYSKDKELLFVTRISPYGATQEEVYESHQIEILPPSVKSGVQYMSFQDKDGLIDATCMSTQQSLVFYNNDKYWNPAVKQQFLNDSLGLWSKDYAGLNRYEQEQQYLEEQINLGTPSNAKQIPSN